MNRTLRSSLIYLAGGLVLALLLTVVSELVLARPYHASANWFIVGLLYMLVGCSLSDSQSLASKSCMYQRNVAFETRWKEWMEAGERFEGNRPRIATSYAFGIAFILVAYVWWDQL